MEPLEHKQFLPRLIAWEVTRQCNLACKHCRAAARSEPYSGELSTEECFRLLDNIASFAKPIIILTGGEPMLRPDIYQIAAYAHNLGLRVVMAPCGALINDETAARIAASGISNISISIDGATAESHDAFRGISGAFDSALGGIEAAKRAGIDFQINTTVTRHNLEELPDILALAVRMGAKVFNPFLLVPTGRGKDLADQEITAEEYERTLQWFAAQGRGGQIPIRVTCAPHYQRILRQEGCPGAPAGHPVKGCMGGQSFAFISHRGNVQICGFLDVECGDLRREDLDFKKIWDTSDVFQHVRDVDSYHGRCGYCDFRKVCGGCRARAFALTGDYLAEEPFCTYQPKRGSRARRLDAELDDMDRKILSIIQTDLPVLERPFDELAKRLGADADEIIARVRRLIASGIIRRMGPVFDSRRLGYVSTLVGARVPAERLTEVAERVSRLQGVTHNYSRRHAFNLWFTLTAQSADEIDTILESLRRETGIEEFHSFPALDVYKIRVNFRLSDDVPPPRAASVPTAEPPVCLDEDQRKLVRLLQDDFAAVEEPFAELAERLGWSRQRVIEQTRDWVSSGVIRRFGAVVNHRRLGFQANAMVGFCVLPERAEAVGRRLAQCTEISHCYRRRPIPEWPYNVFAMVHGQSEDEVRKFVDRIAAELDLSDYDVLFSVTEFKKSSMRYFETGVQQ
ncbi:MAG: radical SAM protein [Planctomycetia bacterium]|nr:radical SAM protein [Planctomycetia bacterium]